jgi:hypothetical protein
MNENAELRQKELQFPTKRGEQLKILRESRVGDAVEKLLLHKLDDRIGNGKTWRLSIEELASEMEVGVSTAYAKVKSLKAKQVIIAERCKDGKFEFQMVWSNLADFVDSPIVRPKKRRKQPRHSQVETEEISQVETEFSQVETEFSQVETEFSQVENGTSYERSKSAQESAHPPNPPTTRHSWEQVKKEIVDCGIYAPADPLREMQSRKCQPHHALEIIQFWRNNGEFCPPAALRLRIINLFPDQKADDLKYCPTQKGRTHDCTAQRKADFGTNSIEEAFSSSDDEEGSGDAPKLLH